MRHAHPVTAWDRLKSISGVVGIHAALAFAFLNMSGRMPERLTEQPVLDIFNVPEERPPEPIVELQEEQSQPKEEEGAASPENIRSEASPVVAPKPEIKLPTPPPVIAAPKPAEGPDPSQGASDRPGPGTGAGGIGTGTGSGGSGSGTGGGGSGGMASRPALLRGITNRDYPAALQRGWPRGGAIFLRLRIEPNGRPSRCDVMRSFGNPMADQWTCSLIMERGVFRPATDDNGRPVSAWFGYIQRDTGRFDG